MAEDVNTNVAQDTQNSSQGTIDNPANNSSSDVEKNPQNDSQLDIEKLIQRAVDRATNKLGNENKKLRTELDNLKKEKLTDDELKQLELKDKEADIADREAKLKEKENRLFAIKAIKDAGLDDGGNNALELADFVMSDDEETTTKRVKVFSDLVKKLVAAEVDQTFKSKGRNPEKSSNSEANATNNIAATIGKVTADRNAAANKVLNYYTNGGKN